MRIHSFGCTNYKAFKTPTDVEVRPLTLFFGKNNSGKSALLRLPRLLLQALSKAAPRGGFPLSADDVSYGRVFIDLIHGRSPHGSASFRIDLESDSGERLDLDATVQNVQELRPRAGEAGELTIVSKLAVREPIMRTLDWDTDQGAVSSYVDVGKVDFRGLLPEAHGDSFGFVTAWRERVDDFRERVSHLGPVRAAARPIYEVTSSQPLGLAGEGAIGWLANDDELLLRAGDWFAANLDGWRLGMDTAGSAVHCTLTRGGTTVNLVDAGQGMQQVLPVVVQHLARRAPMPFLYLVEQPELHLHASAQGPLGDLFLNTARDRIGTVIVETHSENLLLRVRRRIAEGLDPDLVALYWVDERPEGHSVLKRIRIDQDGDVDDWPSGVFSEGYEEIKALRRAARSRKAGA